jgi:hypothetical protein
MLLQGGGGLVMQGGMGSQQGGMGSQQGGMGSQQGGMGLQQVLPGQVPVSINYLQRNIYIATCTAAGWYTKLKPSTKLNHKPRSLKPEL